MLYNKNSVKSINEDTATVEKRDFFAAANSGCGFVSFYKEIFNNEGIKRRFLIKGGPGTGKSTLMRSLANEAERLGMLVERYRCSSDPSSLDGVIINKTVAIIDSTAPHSEEAELVGARDRLIDLGRFWNSESLYLECEKIRLLTQKKKRAYALAYRFLSSAMESDIASREMIIPYINKMRIKRLAARLTRSISTDGGYECKIGLSKAIGMSGKCALDSYISLAKKTVYIEEHYGIGYILLSEICEEARRRGCKISVSYEPLTPDLPDSVFFEESKTLFALSSRRIHGAASLRRALDMSALSKRDRNEIRAKSRNASRLSEALILAAIDELKCVGEAHFELEGIYRANMDFDALNDYTSSIIKQIISLASNN